MDYHISTGIKASKHSLCAIPRRYRELFFINLQYVICFLHDGGKRSYQEIRFILRANKYTEKGGGTGWLRYLESNIRFDEGKALFYQVWGLFWGQNREMHPFEDNIFVCAVCL